MSSKEKKFEAWFFQGLHASKHRPQESQGKEPWWRVMCLTGVDYFSSMGFQPGISYLAAGLLSPLATLNLVILTLIGALPAYWLVSEASPYGQGSFTIFEKLLSGWKGKTLILVLLGFAATDFIFTITMCAADASTHIVQNPWMPKFANARLLITMSLITTLGVVFLVGFREAIKVSVWLVALYLALNLISLWVITGHLIAQGSEISRWIHDVLAKYPSPAAMLGTSVLAFPQLALGLSGFETGVAVMPLIKTQHPEDLKERIGNTRKLLVTVAVIMGVFLIVGSIATTVLIAPELFKEGGPANGRALAYLTHLYLGNGFGTLYDLSTVLILWFAGASGMAALLSLVPQYLPRYGMAPSWAAAQRPLVVFITVVCYVITILFRAEVDAQAGAFATGLLVLITSAIVAITARIWKSRPLLRLYFLFISFCFLYASIAIMWQRPDGMRISAVFIAAILVSSFLSRALRSTELRINKVILDEVAEEFVQKLATEWQGEVRLLAHRPGHDDYASKEVRARKDHSIHEDDGDFIFLEVFHSDVSEFSSDELKVVGKLQGPYPIFQCYSPSVPNAIAALLLHLRDQSGKLPHAYFCWTEGHPLFYVLKYVLLGEGETAPICREILRCAEKDEEKRPKIHVA